MTVARRALAALVLVVALGGCTIEEQIRWAFAQVGAPAHVQDEAVDVSWCESRHQPGARNGSHVGLFQMSTRYHSHRPGMHEPYIAVNNAQAAAHLWAEQGWAPWTCRP